MKANERRALAIALCSLAVLVVGILLIHTPTTKQCVRSHIEVNNVPAHVVNSVNDVYVTVPARKIETVMCDEYAKEESK